MAINFSAQFIVNEKTSTRVLRLTDTSTGFTLSKGNFIITFPDGTQVANTDFANPQITAPGGNTSISLITDVDNTVLTGTYVITYVALNTSLNEFTKTETFDFNWEKPAKAIINDSDVVLPEVQFKDSTAYEASGSFAGTLTRNFYTTTPSTSEVGVITKTSVGDILTPVNASKYYEGIYLVKSDISVAYTHTSKSWLTIAYTDLLEETFDVREAPTQDELVALMNTYKDQIEAYKSTNPSQYEIMNEQYDLVLALYSHILARYQTSTLDGSKAILDQLLGLLPPTEPYTYKATQMLPFTINFTTSLTGSGTVGTLPKFTGTASIGDSIIKEDAGKIGIGKIPTTVLDVDGTIKGTSIVKDGGTSAQFLKADGSVDANTYLTTGSAAGSYQPLDADLTAIAVLAGAAGILTKVSANTWTLDTTSYQVLDADLTAIAALAGTSGLLRKTSANTWELDTTSYQVLDADLTAIAALTGTSGILIKTAANTWSLDTATYQLADADLTAIAALSGTAGLLKKTAANTWVLDTSAYLTGITSGQITTALGYTPENTANKGVNNGYAGLDGSGKVPSTQLPSYVDDVLEYANVAALPTTGETGKIYITLDTNKIYRWSGSVYVEISSSAAVWGGITGTLANQTDLQAALDAKQATLTLTTTGTGGPATLLDATLNIPQYEGGYASQLKHQVKLGATIAKGKAVYVSSADGTNMIVSAASNASEGTSSKTLGLLEAGGVTNDIVNVITEGLLAGLDTSTALAGDSVWLGTNGNLIFGLTNKPVAPAHLVFIGIVTRVQQNNGEIFVKVQNGFELNEIHDVQVGSYGTNDVLYRDTTTNLWKNASIATVLGYTPVSPTQLALKADALNPVFTDNIYISGTNPRLYFTDTDSNPDYTIFIDSGNFYILNQTSGAYKLLIQETGNISAGVGNSMIATSFIRRGGTSDEFLMADGSVSTGAVFNYPAIGIAVSGGGGWLNSIDDNSVNWNAAYSARISSLTTTGNSGAATLASNVLNIPNYTIAGLGGQAALSGTGFVKISGTTISYDNSTYYLASNPSGYITSSALAPYLLLSGGTLTGALGGTSATFSGNVTAASFIRTGGTSAGFLKADGSVDIRTFVTTGALDNYLPLTGGALQNTASSGYVLSVTNVSETSSSNGLYVNIASGSTGTPFRVDRGGVSLITVNYLGATLLKSTVTANSFIKASGTSSEYLMADGSVSTGPSGGITGSLTTGYIPKAIGANTIENSLIFDNGAKIFIGTTTTNNISAGGLTLSNTTSSSLVLYNGGIVGFIYGSTIATGMTVTADKDLRFETGNGSGTSWPERMRLFQLTGNLSLGYGSVPADAGFKLDVNGTGRFAGALSGTSATFSGLITSTITNNAVLTASTSTTNRKYIEILNDGGQFYAGIGGSTPATIFANQLAYSTTIGSANATALEFGTNATIRLSIASTGAATFSSSVAVGTDLTVTGVANFNNEVRAGNYAGNSLNYIDGTNVALTGRRYRASQSRTNNDLGTVGLDLTNLQPTNNVYSPVISFSSMTSGNVQNCTYAAIWGQKTTDEGSWAAGDLIFGTANPYGVTQRMRITSGGNVGINTSSTYARLHVHGGALNPGAETSYGIWVSDSTTIEKGLILGYDNTGDVGIINAAHRGQTWKSIALATNSGSNVLIGTTTGTGAKLKVSGGIIDFAGDTRYGVARVYTASTGDMFGMEQVGSSQIGFTAAATRIFAANASTNFISLGWYTNATSFTDGLKIAMQTGVATFLSSVTATSFFESSDNRLKTLIEDNYQAKGIESITAKLYTKNGVTELGYYAQDVQSILPGAVTTGADGFLNLSYREVHTAKIARLEKRVEELETQLNLV